MTAAQPMTTPTVMPRHSGLPSDAISQQQQAYDPTITAYNDVGYVATAQPSPTGEPRYTYAKTLLI